MSKFPLTGIVRLWAAVLMFGGLPSPVWAADSSSCATSGIALQILGSGGPIADDGRASAGYLVWVDGKSRFLVDAGGGVFLRFAEAGGNFSELDFIGISHFHADHSADLPALLKSGYFANRERDLPISGPAGGGPFPGLHDYLDAMLGKEKGAYGYLSGYLDGSGRLPLLRQTEVHRDQQDTATVLGDAVASQQVDAMYVPHGIVPALAFRVRIGDQSIVFASDQNGSAEQFIDFAKNADVLVMHMPVPQGVSGVGRKLHAPPGVIGEIAAQAQVKTLVLSHFMARSLSDLDANVSIVRASFAGPVVIAKDLDCVAVVD
jgi:ribonuclease BN (tRNA processing enzyme)